MLSYLKRFELVDRKLSVVFDTLGPDEVPLGFPVRIYDNRRNDLRRFLSEHRIYCAVHWILNHLIHIGEYETELCLSEQMLTLPIDQRLNETSLEYIATTIKRFYDDEF